MSWRAAKARKILRALRKIGWSVKRSKGSHKTLEREGWDDYTCAFHDNVEIGPAMLSRIAKRTGLTQEDL